MLPSGATRQKIQLPFDGINAGDPVEIVDKIVEERERVVPVAQSKKRPEPTYELRVRWAGYGTKEDTWEREGKLPKTLIREFRERRAALQRAIDRCPSGRRRMQRSIDSMRRPLRAGPTVPHVYVHREEHVTRGYISLGFVGCFIDVIAG